MIDQLFPPECDRLLFVVPLTPVGQPRPKGRVLKVGRKATVQIYIPKTIKNTGTGVTKPHPIVAFKKRVIEEYRLAVLGSSKTWLEPFLGPIQVNSVFVMPRPKSKVWTTKPMPRYPHIGKPDRDNLDKAVLDALTDGKLAWKDDSQVYSGQLTKWVAAGDEEPRAIVEVVREYWGTQKAASPAASDPVPVESVPPPF